MSASEWTAIGIFVAGLVVSLLVYIVQFLHKMDKRNEVDSVTVKDHGHRINKLEGDTGELKTRVTHLEANR
jgi:membrane protein implicated in regulation of membrane protease activity